ncbi:hypothetical protein MKX03_011572 [Papaver bracteatum]|nr:hypothetical protein MKX03_011572 [Papaver bracteatum]
MSLLNILVCFFLFPVLVTHEPLAYCGYPLSCGVREPQIQFSFILDGRQSNASNKIVLQLPYSGQFFVQEINYTSQEMQIYDPDNCLPRRLLKLRLPLPFPYKLGGMNQDYTFLNCSSSSIDVTNISSLYAPVVCMSSSTHTILATSISDLPFNSSCKKVATVSCQMAGKFRDHRNLFLSCGILMKSTDTNQEAIIIRTGLDDSTIKTYRIILFHEKLELPNPNDTTCTICRSEYRPTEMLKIVPHCNHYFHAKCINPWLRMHTTCPFCRNCLHHSVMVPAIDAS